MVLQGMYKENRKSVILTLFGSSPETRLLDLFMDNPLFEFTRNEIVESLGMSKNTLYNVLPRLEAEDIVEETRQIGKASLYRLNSDSPVVQGLSGLIRAYVRVNAGKEVEDEGSSKQLLAS